MQRNAERIPVYVPSRSPFLLQNELEVCPHAFPDQFLVWSSPIEVSSTPQQLRIFVRRIDQASGWGQILLLRLWNPQKTEFHTIHVGHSDTLQKEMDYSVPPSFPLQWYDENKAMTTEVCPSIPRKIYQTHHRLFYENESHRSAVFSMIHRNPEFEYFYFTDRSAREWIATHCADRVLRCYDLLVPKAFKADFFRVCILWKWGGCYFDHKQVLCLSLLHLFQTYPHRSSFFCYDLPGNGAYNAIMITAPEHPQLSLFLHWMMDRIEEGWIPSHCLGLTGPVALSSFLPSSDMMFQHTAGRVHLLSSQQLVVWTEYAGYRSHRKEDYASLFHGKQVYYQNHQILDHPVYGKLTFMTFPELCPGMVDSVESVFQKVKTKGARRRHLESRERQKIERGTPFQDRFSIDLLDLSTLRIRRCDQHQGWGMDLKLLLIRHHYSVSVHVGPSESVEKRVSIPSSLVSVAFEEGYHRTLAAESSC